uniref:Uncharacterized protein n=1 Tax=Knipowitschia caucasica TaxID=637954 RepID=A0AAV2MQ47_KNICA
MDSVKRTPAQYLHPPVSPLSSPVTPTIKQLVNMRTPHNDLNDEIGRTLVGHGLISDFLPPERLHRRALVPLGSCRSDRQLSAAPSTTKHNDSD